MSHAIASTITAAAILLFSSIPPSEAQIDQQPMFIQLDQSLLDHWLVAMPAIAGFNKSSAAPKLDEMALSQLERICTEAGFDSYDRCGETIGYVGMIVSGFDWRTRSFRDPIAMMRREIGRIEANDALSSAEKDKATSSLKEIVARFPSHLPRAG